MIKRTLKEWANFTGCYVAMDYNGTTWCHKSEPCLKSNEFIGSAHVRIEPELLDYSGNWRESLTAPDEPPFKDGELLVEKGSGALFAFRYFFGQDHEAFRRPTPEEWKKLRGEE